MAFSPYCLLAGPWHIAGINIAGSGVLGIVASSPSLPPRQKALLGVGFCGALTTFSTYSVDVVKLIDAGRMSTALSYVAMNNAGSIGAAFLGMRLGRRLSLPAAFVASKSLPTGKLPAAPGKATKLLPPRAPVSKSGGGSSRGEGG